MKTQRQIAVELQDVQDNIKRLQDMEIGIQAIYFIATRAPDRISPGTLDRARAVVDRYLLQFIDKERKFRA